MGIYLPNMEMPENCVKCLCFERCYTRGIFDPLGWCHITGTELLSPNPPQDCPLIPVPPHGRLIDADALIKSDRMVGKMMVYGGEYVYCQAEIDRAPTIIPAEEGE